MADNRRLSNSSSKALIYYLEGEKRGRPTSGRGQMGPEAGAIDRTDCRSIHNCTREHEENEADRHRRHPSHNIRTSSSNSQSDETPNVVRFNEQPPPLCVRLDVCSRTRRKSALLIEPSALPQFLRIRLRDDDNKSPGGTDDRNSFRSATNTSASRPEYKHQTPGWTMAAGGGGWWPSQTGRCSIYGASFVVIIKSLGLGGRNVHFLRSDGSASVGFLRWPTSVSQTNGAADMISTGIRSIPVRLVLFFACHTARSRLQIGTTKRRLGRGRWPWRQFLSVICSLNWKDIPIGCEMASQSGSRTASM